MMPGQILTDKEEPGYRGSAPQQHMGEFPLQFEFEVEMELELELEFEFELNQVLILGRTTVTPGCDENS